MKGILVHIHTGHEPTILAFIASMFWAGWVLTDRAGYKTQTGTEYLRFRRKEI